MDFMSYFKNRTLITPDKSCVVVPNTTTDQDRIPEYMDKVMQTIRTKAHESITRKEFAANTANVDLEIAVQFIEHVLNLIYGNIEDENENATKENMNLDARYLFSFHQMRLESQINEVKNKYIDELK